jgi:hypothetical protein
MRVHAVTQLDGLPDNRLFAKMASGGANAPVRPAILVKTANRPTRAQPFACEDEVRSTTPASDNVSRRRLGAVNSGLQLKNLQTGK